MLHAKPPTDASHKDRKIPAISISVAGMVGRASSALRSKKLEMEKRTTKNPQSKNGRT